MQIRAGAFGMRAANSNFMTEPIPSILHLASMIDAKESKLERTTTPFIRRQLMADLESLVRRFQVEYQLCLGENAHMHAEAA